MEPSSTRSRLPVEDAYTAPRWLHEHAGEPGIDRGRIAVKGVSAGGVPAAALSILTRERGGPASTRQILLMPMLDDRATTPDPHIEPYLLWPYDAAAPRGRRCSGRGGRSGRARHGGCRPARRRARGCPRPHRDRPA
ncbi:alpha/beta hydrolase fold domain-containing protein [Streptomyces sp. NPDC005423]|uniref:alpha/beta hydrolase fold domain-containing protein n=1 Tax=Streptomyces sp. NPDC005423 TaxID=3155343 RepID=UPI00339FF2AE